MSSIGGFIQCSRCRTQYPVGNVHHCGTTVYPNSTAEYVYVMPTAEERIAAALERIAAAMEKK